MANEACSEFLRDFLAYQRQENGFSLGAARKEKNVDKFSQRELSLLEFCRPANYIGQLWKTSPEAQAIQASNESSPSGESVELRFRMQRVSVAFTVVSVPSMGAF